MQFAQIRGGMIHFRLDGRSDGTPLVLIHSLGTDLRLWDAIIPAFAATFKIVRYDIRGHGLSDCPTEPYSIRKHTDDLAGLLNYLQLDNVILAGISVGGMISMSYAGAQPARVTALVLVDTGTTIGSPNLWNDRIAALRQKGMEPLADGLVARWFPASFIAQQPMLARGYRNLLTRMPLEGYIATCEAIRDADLSAEAKSIKTRTLVLCGSEDVAVPADMARAFAGSLANADFALIENAGHLPSVDQPDKVVVVMKDFLQEFAHVR